MHLSLSDLLACPRCGPAHGLILLPDEVRGRRVVTGVLGCPNCRERYPVEDGITDLRVPGAGSVEQAPTTRHAGARHAGDDPAVRLAALLGLEAAAGVVVVAGPVAAHAPALARLVDAIEGVTLGGFGGPDPIAGGELSHILVGPQLPFRDASLAGIALTGPATVLLEASARTLRPAARLLLEPVGAALRMRAQDAGMIAVLDAQETLVVARP
jgi:uncharacterized protein YbaR (Trm112 family)